MAHKPAVMRLRRPEPVERLNAAAAREYFIAMDGVRSFIGEQIVGPFEKSAKRRTGYGERRLPVTKDVTELVSFDDYGIVISVESARTTSVSYEKAYSRIFGDGATLLDMLESEGLRAGYIKRFDDGTYIEAGFMRDRILELIARSSNPSMKQSMVFDHDIYIGKGESRSIALPEGLTTAGQDIVRFPLLDYGAISVETAEWYLRGLELDDWTGRNVTEPFVGLVKKRTGYSKENVPEATVTSHIPLGSHMFVVTSAPQKRVSWGKVMNTLASRDSKGQLSGELNAVAENDIDDTTDIYGVVRRDGKNFVSIDSLRKRASQLKALYTTDTVEQKIAYYPGSL